MKKILCFLLCLMLLIPSAVSLAAITVSSVYLYVTPPDGGSLAQPSSLSVTSWEENRYIVQTITWLQSDLTTELASSTELQAGESYYVKIQLAVYGDRVFADEMKITFWKENSNNESPYVKLVDYSLGLMNSVNYWLYITAKVTIPKRIQNVTFSINAPAAGKKVTDNWAEDDIAFPSGADFYLAAAYWKKKNGSDYEDYHYGDRFLKDNTYLKVALNPNPNCFFDNPDLSGVTGGSLVSGSEDLYVGSSFIEVLFKVNLTGEDLPVKTAIPSVSLSVTPPEAGQTAAVSPRITVPSGAHYAVVSNSWKWKADSDFSGSLSTDTQFESSHYYYGTIELQADDGYEFANGYSNSSVGITGGSFRGCEPILDSNDYNSKLCVKVAVQIAAVPVEHPIDVVSLTVALPEAGSTAATPPDVKVTSGASYRIENEPLSWVTSTNGYLDPETVFKAGRSYYVYAVLQASAGYGFTESTRFNITNATVERSNINSSDPAQMWMMLKVKVPGSSHIIDVISLAFTPPQAGSTAENPPAISVPSGANYTIGQVIDQMPVLSWMTENGGEMAPDAVFEAGKTYYAFVQLKAVSGYEFDEDVRFSIPGATVDFSSGAGTDDYTQMILVLMVKIPGGADSAPAPAGPIEKVTLSKLKSVKLKALSAKKIEIKWKKLSKKDQKKIQKIQIQYSTDKTFKTGVKTKWAKKTKSSYTIKGLKKNTKYYVRIRAYKKDGNTVYVSKWVTKNKKTKKK